MLATVCFIVFSLFVGYLEAYFWASHPKVHQRWSHIALTILRAIVVIPVLYYEGWLNVLGLMCMFPFLHDGAYYQTRNYINPKVYPKGWKDESFTTGALISLSFPVRCAFALAGILFIILGII